MTACRFDGFGPIIQPVQWKSSAGDRRTGHFQAWPSYRLSPFHTGNGVIRKCFDESIESEDFAPEAIRTKAKRAIRRPQRVAEGARETDRAFRPR